MRRQNEVVGTERATLVANSIGCISALQASADRPELFDGVFLVNPNFRELHAAEQPALLRPVVVPVVAAVQRALRAYGQGLFDALANPPTVKAILKEPYEDEAAVTDELVDVLLTPLLGDGAVSRPRGPATPNPSPPRLRHARPPTHAARARRQADVVFDTLSYSAGPLPEPLLAAASRPVAVCFGEADPWTPPDRVRALSRFDAVRRVVGLPRVGHCPHDERPDLVNPLIVDFVNEVSGSAGESARG